LKAAIGIIGGSGLYDIEGIRGLSEKRLRTPFGAPSGPYLVGTLSRRPVVFLARHGRGHRHAPSEVNFRANIYGMKMLGVERIISVSAVGSMKEEIHPMDLVFPDQFIDRTTKRAATFFGGGIVAHVGLADPVCPDLRAHLDATARGVGASVHSGGCYLNIEGPQFSTRAESNLYRSWGASVIGMTNVTEARLAREAEICYATMALVTDYDCWHVSEEAVSVEAVLEYLKRNAENARRVIAAAVAKMPKERACACGSALKNAIITQPGAITATSRRRLGLIVRKYLK